MRPLRTAGLLALLVLAGCGRAEAPDADGPAPTSSEPAAGTVPSEDRERVRALEAALDTLEAFVLTLERVATPIDAWNRAPEAARLMRALDSAQADLTLDMPEEEARRRFGPQITRFEGLQARRIGALERITEDAITARVFFEEVAKADTAAAD